MLIKIQVLLYGLMLVVGSIFLPFRSKYAYRDRLIVKYNQIDEKQSAFYLDELHTKFACCGVMGQKFNITRDPTIWNPDDQILRKLPNSCCKLPYANRCAYTNVHPTTCEIKFDEAARTYKKLVLSLLSVTTVFTLVALFALNRIDFSQKTKQRVLSLP